MNIISQESKEQKLLSYVLLGISAFLALSAVVTGELGYVIFSSILAFIGLSTLIFPSSDVALSHDFEGKFIVVSRRKKHMTFPLDEVLNLTEGGTYGRNESTTTYHLTVRNNQVFGKHISFSISSGDIQYKDNYYILRGEIIKLRSKRAKEWAYGKS